MAITDDIKSLQRQIAFLRQRFQDYRQASGVDVQDLKQFRDTVIANVQADRARLDAIEADLVTVHNQLQQLNQRTNSLDARITALGG